MTQPEPASGFTRFSLSPAIRRGIDSAGFVDPRPVQAETIPAALEGRDVLGLAQTGTGKTAAFALPVLERLLRDPGPGPRVLIVAPTRELATQIAAEIGVLGQFTPFRTATIFGGVSERPQVTALRARPEIVVACPGRLLDLLSRGLVRLDRIDTLILDEADHMFDMGFLPDLRRILAALPARRQNMMFSATMPKEIRQLADRILREPVVVELAHSRPASTIEHFLLHVDGTEKLGALQGLLAEAEFRSAIVFTRTKHRARRLAKQLAESGHRAVALQGNMSQGQRDRAMNGFRGRQFDVLVATDIAARGIDVQQVSHVINFDVPITPDLYTHRIGRTGRAEHEGRAFTLVTAEDHDLVRDVERRIGARIPHRPGTRPAPPVRTTGPDPRRRGRTPDTGRRGQASKRGRGGGTRSSPRSGPIPDSPRSSAAPAPRKAAATAEPWRPGSIPERSRVGMRRCPPVRRRTG